MMLKSLSAATVALVLAAAVGNPACAAEGYTVQAQKQVDYSDLNPSAVSGARTLLVRITQAAQELCGPKPRFASDDPAEFEACVSCAVNRAVADLGNPLVTALNGGGAVPELVASRN